MKHYKNILIFLILGIFFEIFLFYALISNGSIGGEDSYEHYLFSRYAINHPKLFLDQWGKPLFTLFSSPFSQFGFVGIKFFNIILALFSAYFTFKTAELIKKKNSFLVVFFLCLTPMFFLTALSGLTEILFGFLLIFSIYLYLKDKEALSIIIVSLLPYSRSEGYLLIPLFFIFLILKKKFHLIPLLITGTIIYNFIGFLVFGNILWFITSNPYLYASISGGSSTIYGNGSFSHFIWHLPEINGLLITILLILGLFEKSLNIFKRINELFLIYIIFIFMFLAYSVFWWLGIFGSLGELRNIITLSPLIALISLDGFNYFTKVLFKKKISLEIFGVLYFTVISLLILDIFSRKILPVKLNPEQEVILELVRWYPFYENSKTYYFYPFLSYCLNIDPYDNPRVGILSDVLSQKINSGSIVIWDSHFGPNDMGVPLEFLKNNKDYKLLRIFKPQQDCITLNNYKFVVQVFRKN